MKFEVLKKSHLKRFIVIGVVVVIIISAIILNFTRAKYRTAQSMPLINGTVNYDLADLNMVAVYIEDESASDRYAKVDTIPTEGYVFNEEISYCAIDGARDDSISLSYDLSTQTLSVVPITIKGTKCYLYFDKQVSIKDTLLSYYPTVKTRTDFSTTVTDTTTGVIYRSADSSQYDDDGEVYYFAGNPTDNWIYFAGFYWRIIRINGDGSIRLIYQGTSANTTGTGTQIGNSFIGFMYTVGSEHGYDLSSSVKILLDEWYVSNLFNYVGYLDFNSGFCGDRNSTVFSNSVRYGSYNRLIASKRPIFTCENNLGLFTISESGKGNNALTYPIGLITADEVAYAGGVQGENNQSYYLYTGEYYWTMSPSMTITDEYISVARVGSRGFLEGDSIMYSIGIRPVINLRADVTISSGDGTASNPFVIA